MPERPAGAAAGALLAGLARGALAERFGLPVAWVDRTAWLERPAATFVTLTLAGALRGCIGSLEPRRPLVEDVRANALAAAFEDYRFPPVEAAELPRLGLEVSLLSPLEPLPPLDEAAARAALRPGSDGVVLAWQGRRGTFLPQVWEQLPRPEEFLRHLKRKAGLDPGFWAPDLRLFRYSVEKWEEAPDRPALLPRRAAGPAAT
ncbi:MAG: AmmeMemoRadiSam system protein A [Thermoanaerobaculia bacterium]|nr:AmmeMemoRadiSam system protein A [Thermoanaerobaculia bacterium]